MNGLLLFSLHVPTLSSVIEDKDIYKKHTLNINSTYRPVRGEGYREVDMSTE